MLSTQKNLQNRNLFTWIIMSIGVLLMTPSYPLFAQEQGQSQEETQENPEKDKTELEQLEDQVLQMQTDINVAIQALEKVSQGSHQERLDRLDAFLKVAQGSLDELSDGGTLYETLKEAIAKTDEARQRNDGNANDPQISAEVRQRYTKLVNRLADRIEDLYEKKTMIEGQREQLDKNIRQWNDEKDFIAELILVDDLDAANAALLDVFNSVKDVNTSMEDFANKMLGKEPPAKPED